MVTNKGNTALTSITLTETFQRGNGTSISLDAGPTFNSSTGGSAAGSLQTGESATYTASYTVDATDVATTRVQNQVTVSAQTLDGSLTRTDVSDDGDDLDGNTQNDVTEVRIKFQPYFRGYKNSFYILQCKSCNWRHCRIHNHYRKQRKRRCK